MTLQEYKDELLKVASDIEELLSVEEKAEAETTKQKQSVVKTAEEKFTKEATETMESGIGSLGDISNKQTAESYILDFVLN